MNTARRLAGPAVFLAVATSCTSAPFAMAPTPTWEAGASPSPAASSGERAWVDEPPLGPLPVGSTPRPPTSEDAVSGYLEAVHTVTADDDHIRHRRHHPWLHPQAADRTGGHWTTDPPPAGVTRRVEIISLDLVASTDGGAVWAVAYRLWDGPDLHAHRARHVTTRQHDDAWFVVAETVRLQPVPH